MLVVHLSYLKDMLDQALNFIEEAFSNGFRVLVHCNLRESRSPSIGLLYLARISAIKDETLEAAEKEFITIYPIYNPKFGLKEHLLANWPHYCRR